MVAGQGRIDQPNAMTTRVDQQSNRLVVDWSTFNLSKGERVNFNQPSAKAAALNRITGQQPSQILGDIKANGRVFLLNPNGILFGPSAHVNVGSLFATSLKIKPSDFMAGRLNFAAPKGKDGGAIINQGLIAASGGGSVNLFGSNVSNSGLIMADLGQVNLAAGHTVTVDFDGDGLIRLAVQGKVSHNASGAEAAVSNTGKISASGGRVLMSAAAAKAVFKNAVNNSGVVAARGIERDGGVMRLVGAGGATVNSGRLDVSASGEHADGGAVSLTGENVVQAGEIDADAGQRGTGGKVSILARDTTTMSGHISARGGRVAGVGGSAEVSAQRHLAISGFADLSAPHGQAGTLLLDPDMIKICHLSDSCSTGSDVFSDKYIETQLGLNNFTISTTSVGADASIDFHDKTIDIVSDSGHSLSLIAGQEIKLQGRVQLTGSDSSGNTARLNLSAPTIVNKGKLTLGGLVTSNQALDFSNSPLQLDPGSALRLDTSGSNQPITLGEVEGPGNLLVASGSGDVSLGTLGGAEALAGFTDASSGTTTLHGDITSAGGAVNFAGAVRLAKDVTVTTGGSAPGDISFGAAVDGASPGKDALRLDAGAGDITFAGPVGGRAPLAALTINTANDVTADGDITLGSLRQLAGTGLSRFNGLISTSAAGGINLSGQNVALMDGVSTVNGGGLTVANAATLTLGGELNLDGEFRQTGAGATQLNANILTTADDIAFDAPVTLGADVRLDTGADAGDINFSAQASVDGRQSLTLAAGSGDMRLAAPFGSIAPLGAFHIASAASTMLGAGIATAGGAMSFAAPLTLTNTVALDTSRGAPAGADIEVSAPLDVGSGKAGLTLNAGTAGDIAFAGPVGGMNPLGAVTIENAHDVELNAFNAASLTQRAGTGTTRFDAAASTRGAAGIDLQGNNFTIAAPLQTADRGALHVNNDGLLAVGAPLMLAGGFAQTGAGSIALMNNIDAASGGIAATSLLALAQGSNLALSAETGDIALAGGVEGAAGGAAEQLTLYTGGGNVRLGPVGSAEAGGLADLTVTSAGAVDYAGPVILRGALEQISAGGPTRFSGDVNVAVATLKGGAFSVLAPFISHGRLSVANSGVLKIGAGAPITANGGFSADGAASSAGDVTTAGTPLVFKSMLALPSNANVTLRSQSGELRLGAVNGAGGGELTLSSGAGGLTLGSATGLNRLTLITRGQTALSGDLTAATLDFSELAGAVTTAGSLGLSSNNSMIDLSHASVDASASGGALDINAGIGDVRLGPVGAQAALAKLSVQGADITLGNVMTSGAQHYTGITTLTSDLAANGHDGLTFSGPVRLVGDQLHLHAADGGIQFEGSVNGGHALAVNAGPQDVSVAGAVGNAVPLNSLALSGANIDLGAPVTTTGAQTYTGATRLGGDLRGSSLSFTGPVAVPVTTALTANTIAFNGGSGSISGNAPLSIQPLTVNRTVSLGAGGGTSLTTAPLANYAGGLTIGGRRLGRTNITPRAGKVVVNGDLDLGRGTLTLIGTDGIDLRRGEVRAADLTLLAADQNAGIAASGGVATQLIGDHINLVAGANVGAGLGQEIRARALSTQGELQIASGGSNEAFIVNLDDSLRVSTGFAATQAIEFADALGLRINTDQTVTNAGQVTALRQQTVDSAGSLFVDPALFRDISLYDISGTGLLLPPDQREAQLIPRPVPAARQPRRPNRSQRGK